MFRIVRTFLRLQWLWFAVALLPTASQAQVCNGQLTLLYLSGPTFAIPGSDYRIGLNLAPNTTPNSVAGNVLTINRVRFELDCSGGGIPCTDAGNFVKYNGDATILTDCTDNVGNPVTFSSNVPAGGSAVNDIIFTPSTPIQLSQIPFENCNLSFDTEVVQTTGAGSQILQIAGFNIATSDGTCDVPGDGTIPSGSQGSGILQICNESLPCNDNSLCTTDVCDPNTGECVFTSIAPCNDNSACTTDTCNPATGCVFTTITCNDGSACTTDTCNPATGCVFTAIAPCTDSNACTTDTCNPATGCVFTPIAPCTDGSACTTDTCVPATGCVFTAIGACTDNNACTTDTCDPATGCVFTPIAACTDNNACTTDTCNPATGCVFTPIAPCTDGNACTTDTCVPATGCVFTPIAPCNDNSACTIDTCNPATGCVFTPLTCNDGNACTIDTCNPATGCVFTPITCNDSDPCTDDTCTAAGGCVFTPNPALCPPIPVVPTPASPAGMALIGGLAVSIGWMLNRMRRGRQPR